MWQNEHLLSLEGNRRCTLSCFIRARRPDDVELTIDLIELEDALEGGRPGDYYLLPDSGRIVFVDSENIDNDDEQGAIQENIEALPIDAIGSRTHFQWMEDFIDSVHSITAQNALRDALRQKKAFRNFKDALTEFPLLRKKWFQFQAQQIKREALDLIESLDWEILEIVDPRPVERITEEIDPAENVPLTADEHECILRGAWQIAAKGGRNQLALLLKGSKNKSLLKHGLDRSPVYGKLSFLTIEEIENRIDQLIRKGELRTEFFGDLPLILLTNESWSHVRPWAHRYECEEALSADTERLNEILLDWRNRRREEQYELLEVMASLQHESATRVLQIWRELAGKEMRSKIQSKLSACG